MTTLTTHDTGSANSGTPSSTLAVSSQRRSRAITPIPLTRLMGVELRKMFDTRAGFWLMASVLVAAVLASAAVIIWAPDEALNLGNFSAAIGMPLAIVLPMIAILSITSEYSQRSGLTTYTLVPWRGRVVLAKWLVTLGVGVVSMALALAVGALGTAVGTSLNGVDAAYDLDAQQLAQIVLAQVLGMMVGFTLGVIIRNSPGAIVAYFVYSLVLPGALGMLAMYQEWFRDLWPWVDVQYNITRLFDTVMTAEMWQQLGVTTLLWLVVPMAVGVRMVVRGEIK